MLSFYRFERALFYSSWAHVFSIRRNIKMGKHEMVSMFGATTLGALWQPIALGVNIFGIGVIFGTLFDLPVERYVPFLCAGMILWQSITSVINDSSGHLTYEAPNTPYVLLIIYPLRIWAKHVLVNFLNWSIYVVVALIFGKSIGVMQFIFFMLGYSIFIWTLMFLAILCSLLGSFYKDFSNVVGNLLQLSFFITPVMWEPGNMAHKWIFQVNPLYHFIEVVRGPLVSWSTYEFSSLGIMALIGTSVSMFTMYLWAGLSWTIPYKQ